MNDDIKEHIYTFKTASRINSIVSQMNSNRQAIQAYDNNHKFLTDQLFNSYYLDSSEISKSHQNVAKMRLKDRVNSIQVEGVKSKFAQIEPRRVTKINPFKYSMVKEAIETIKQIEAQIQTDE